MLIGAHESVAGGVSRAWSRAVDDGCEAVQVWVRSSRAWKSKPLARDEVDAWHAARAKAGSVRAVVAHSSYLVNLATGDDALLARSLETMTDELERCEALGIGALVFHPGAHRGDGEEVGIGRVAAGLDELIRRTAGFSVKPCLENTAGQGTNLGWRFEHLAGILDRVAVPERVGVCFDTQHAFAAGHDLASADGWTEVWQRFDDRVGLHKLAAMHLNDSKTALGSRKDRHELIGEGELGLEPFRRLVNDPRFEHVPGLLETPAKEKVLPYRGEIALLKGLRAEAPTR